MSTYGKMLTSDQDVAEGYLRGEAHAVALVDGWLSAASWPFLRRLPDEREDILQEVRLETLRLLGEHRFRGESSLKTYLWRVACHTCIDALRRRRRAPFGEAAECQPELPAVDPSPLDVALQGERQRFVVNMLERLPMACRELWRSVLAGHSYQEIAADTGIAEGTLRVRAYRCRKLALEHLAGNATEPADAQGFKGVVGGLSRLG